MAIFKVTFIFQGGARGWSESYWLNGIGTDHTKQVPAVVTLAKLRAKCLGSPCFIKGYRISLESEGPDALLSYDRFEPAKVVLGSGAAPLIAPAAQGDVALLIRCSNATQSKHKFVFMRGIWDSVEGDHGEYEKNDTWNRVINPFLNKLTSGPWGWMGVDPTQKVAKVPVLNVEEGLTGLTTFSFQANLFPALLPVKSRVKIRVAGVNGKGPANGVHIVYNFDRQSCVTAKPLAPGKYRFGGIASYTPLTFIPIENAEDQKIVERHAGAPLLPSRGRQPAKPRG